MCICVLSDARTGVCFHKMLFLLVNGSRLLLHRSLLLQNRSLLLLKIGPSTKLIAALDVVLALFLLLNRSFLLLNRSLLLLNRSLLLLRSKYQYGDQCSGVDLFTIYTSCIESWYCEAAPALPLLIALACSQPLSSKGSVAITSETHPRNRCAHSSYSAKDLL